MKKLLLIFVAAAVCFNAGAWSLRNHATVAYIASQHLTPKAYDKVTELLGGETMMYYASWMDFFRQEELIRLDAPDKKTGAMKVSLPHTFMVDETGKPTCKKKRDGIWVIEDSIKKLQHYEDLDDSTSLACMKQLIHLLGDVHCPVHVKYKGFKSGKKYYTSNDKEIALHKYIDGALTEGRFPGGMVDYAIMADPMLRPRHTAKDEKYMAEIQKGTPREWATEIAARCKWINSFPEGTKFTVYEEQQMAAFCKDEILRAGYRLAKIFNDIFD